MKKSLLAMWLFSRLVWADPVLDEMTQLADVVFSGNGTAEMVEWENFTMQLTPDMEPIDIARLFRPESNMNAEQLQGAKMVFLKSQALANLERGGKTMTQFLESRGFTVSIYDHEFNPALMYAKSGEPSRRFDFVRRDGQLKLARVSLQPAGTGVAP
jgi:hypothetical protein